jgi:hypothetical protein
VQRPAVDPWLVLVIAAAVVSRPIEARLWRARRISDRAFSVALVARFPIVVFLFAAIDRAPLPLIPAITALAILPGALVYRTMLGLVRDQAAAS